MIDLLQEPDDWLILFHRRSACWVERLCPGPWKHVTALGFVARANVWVLVSWELGRFRVAVVPDGDVETLVAQIGDVGGVLRTKRPPFDTGPWRPRAGLFCTSMVAHLLGLRRGALFPTGLWRLLVAHGAEVVADGRPIQTEGRSARTERSGKERCGRGRCRAA